jgi:hypothetical protein
VSWKPLMHSNPKAITSAATSNASWPAESVVKDSSSSTATVPAVAKAQASTLGPDETRNKQ